MEEGLILKVTAISVLGMAAQWLAWRTQLPAIVLLSLAGLLAGPVLGVLHPPTDFGALLQPMISFAVAVILFEGGLNLNFRELRETAVPVRRLVVVGGPLAWALTAGALLLVAGLSLPVAALLGGILVVTGPTVILPMLRQAKLSSRPASVLKWEGIVNDPIGAMAAVIVFEFAALGGDHAPASSFAWLLGAAGIAVAGGVALGKGVVEAFARGLVPEHLKAPTLLAVVLVGFVAANQMKAESGLLTVTALGITLANAHFPSLEEMRRFKENLSVILVSAVFVLLTASLEPGALLGILDWRIIAFIILLLFVIRPLSIWISTIGSGMTWQERTLIGWIAPRGVVAVAVSGFFGSRLQHAGYPDAAAMVPLTFAIVFATVLAHGFSIRPLARSLGLVVTGRPGVLIVGASKWSVALARALIDLKVPVLLADSNWHRLRPARHANVPTHFGEILSEAASYHIELARYTWILAVSGNEAYNAFVCTHMAPQFGREKTLQLGPHEFDEHEHRGFAATARGRTLISSGADLSVLEERLDAGWIFQKTQLTEVYGWDQYQSERPEEAESLFVVRANGDLLFGRHLEQTAPKVGDTAVSFAPAPARARRKAAAVLSD